eukprot:1320695-Alexandrium_andersonii.AAC.1
MSSRLHARSLVLPRFCRLFGASNRWWKRFGSKKHCCPALGRIFERGCGRGASYHQLASVLRVAKLLGDGS